MLDTQSDQKKDKAPRLKQNLIKSYIMDRILRNRESIPEPRIREILKEKYGVKDQGTINTHLHSLEKLGCITLIPPNKEVTRANRWNIIRLENLESIRQHFPEISLNKYEKSLETISKSRLLHKNPPRHSVFIIMLMLSSSFFDTYVKTDIEAYNKRAYEIYRLGEGYDEDQLIKTYVDEVYTDFAERIFIPSDIWRRVWDTYIKDSLNLEIHRNSLPSPPIIDLQEKTFREMLRKTSFPENRLPTEISGRKILKEITLKVSSEILQKTLKEIEIELPRDASKMTFELSDAIFKKIEEEYPNELYTKIVEIKNYDLNLIQMTPFIIFNHCFNCDLFENTLSEGEMDFVEEKRDLVRRNKLGGMSYDESYIKDVASEFKDLRSERVMSEYRAYEELYDKYFKKYMIPYL